MTQTSTHAYSAALDDDTALPLTGGEITLDAGRIPHVGATLTVAVENAALLADLDPRDSRRVVVTAQRDASVPRVFDLGIRSSTPNRADGTVTLDLASDEAVLQDFAQLADDKTPRTHEASIRAVVAYVLDKIDADLETGTEDADVTAYWPVTNVLSNPSLETNADDWIPGAGASGLVRTVMASPAAPSGTAALGFTAAAGDANVIPAPNAYATSPGKWHVFSAYIVSTIGRPAQAVLQWWSNNGVTVSAQSFGPAVTTVTSEFRRVFVIAQAPPGVSHVLPYVHTVGNPGGNQHYVDCAMFYEGDEVVPYFDGATADDAHYEYEWQAEPHGSTSTRTPIIERRPESLIWQAGVSAMDFLHPLLLTTGLRLVCDEQRRWTLRSEAYRAAGAQTWRYGVNITDATENLSRDDESWFDAAVYVYVWTDADGIEQSRTDAFSLTPTPTKVLRRELRNTPYPGPGRAQHIVTRAQGKGREVTVSGIPSWTEHTDQALSVLLDGTPIQTGISSRVRFDLDTDEVGITSRTTDTPYGAIDLLAGTINALTGTIAAL